MYIHIYDTAKENRIDIVGRGTNLGGSRYIKYRFIGLYLGLYFSTGYLLVKYLSKFCSLLIFCTCLHIICTTSDVESDIDFLTVAGQDMQDLQRPQPL